MNAEATGNPARTAGAHVSSATAAPFRPEPRFDLTQAIAESWRCLQCFDAPCTRACPAEIAIPRFIRMIRSRNFTGAAEVVRSANPMAASCGVACPDPQLCGSACVRGRIDRPVEIRRLHRFATDFEQARGGRPPITARATRHRVAVIGTGPAGLSCAIELRRLGCRVVLFERRNRVGGVLSRTIPAYRFPDEIRRQDAAFCLNLHGRRPASEIDLRLRTAVDDLEALGREFDSVFFAPGLAARESSLPGAHLAGVVTAVKFLERCHPGRPLTIPGPEVMVIGGGNVAVDAAIAALCYGRLARAPRRHGVDPRVVQKLAVHLLYRRTRREMPAWERELEAAESAGVILHPLVAPVAFEGERGRLRRIRLSRMALDGIGADGRFLSRPLAGSEFTLSCDLVILATGMGLDSRFRPELPLRKDGRLRAAAGTQAVKGAIFAGGDAAGSEMSIVAAVRDGKRAARAIAARLGLAR